MVERRKSPRISAEAKVIYKFMGIAGERREAVVDISQGGIRLPVREKAKKETLVELAIILSPASKPFFALGKVVWQSEKPRTMINKKAFYDTGIKFCAMNIEHKMSIIKYIYDTLKKKQRSA